MEAGGRTAAESPHALNTTSRGWRASVKSVDVKLYVEYLAVRLFGFPVKDLVFIPTSKD